MFIKWESFSVFTFVLEHVDDFNVNGTSEKELDAFGTYLRTKYPVTENNDGVYLGSRITLQPDGSSVFTKPHQLANIFEKYLPDGPIYLIPEEPITDIYIKTFELEAPMMSDPTAFRSLLGALQQLIDSRPDICFSLSKIAQRTQSPRDKDYMALMHVVHYLYGTMDKGLRLRSGNQTSAVTAVKLRGYADCGYACHGNGKSQYCICFDLVPEEAHDDLSPLAMTKRTGMFYFKSWMAPTVDLSSCEGELSTVVELAKDCILYRGIL